MENINIISAKSDQSGVLITKYSYIVRALFYSYTEARRTSTVEREKGENEGRHKTLFDLI